jgi:hypothetical protein
MSARCSSFRFPCPFGVGDPPLGLDLLLQLGDVALGPCFLLGTIGAEEDTSGVRQAILQLSERSGR